MPRRREQKTKLKWQDRIRAAIKKSNKSNYRICIEANVCEGSLSRFMRGETSLLMDVAERVCAVIGLDLIPTEKKA